MPKLEDVAGVMFGLLLARERVGQTKHKQAVWRFTCTADGCGCDIEKPLFWVKGKPTANCGCMTSSLKSTAKTKHGESASTEYSSYKSMLARCFRVGQVGYENYGGRGITVCDRWLGAAGVANFISDMGRKPTPVHTLERVDVNGNYTPENCKWVTRAEQASNTRRNVFVEVGGEVVTATKADSLLHGHLNIVGYRLRRGWDMESATSKPLGNHKKLITYNGETMSHRAWEKRLGFGSGLIQHRVNKMGMTIEQALSTPVRKWVHREPLLPKSC